MVVIALRINSAILRNVAKGKEHYSYCGYGSKFVNEELDSIACHLSKFLERQEGRRLTATVSSRFLAYLVA